MTALQPSPLAHYSVRELAELLGLTEAETRRSLRSGFVPGVRAVRSRVALSFQDLSLLRSAARLITARVPPHRVRRALSRLREQVPAGRHLSALALSADGGNVVARDGEFAWETESQQLLLDFAGAPSAPARWRRALALPVRSEAPGAQAESHYERGLGLEELDPRGARHAYEQALVLAPGHADALLNLGRLLHAAGELSTAELLFRRAAAARPEDAIAAFNLGVALEDQGRTGDALAAYGRALALDSSCEDAHFNAARLYERQGERELALRHLKAYRRLVQGRDPEA